MSAFGDNNFKADVYENLDWIVSDNKLEKLSFLHETILDVIANGYENVNEQVLFYIEKWDLKEFEVKGNLAEIYAFMVSYHTSDYRKGEK